MSSLKRLGRSINKAITSPITNMITAPTAILADAAKIKVPTAEEIGKKLSIETLTGGEKKKRDEQAAQAKEAETKRLAESQAAAQARVASGQSSGSQFMDMSDKYIAKFGEGENTVRAMLGDLTSGAFNPIAQQFGQMASQAGPQVNIDPAFRNYQMGLANQLAAQARGEGPSLAQLQLQQATDRTLNQSLGAIRAATGPNAALAGRTAALAASGQMANMGAASGIARLQEQQAAQNALAQLAQQGRQADTAGESLRVGTDLEGRRMQQSALQGQMDASGRAIQGSRDVFGGILGIGTQERADQEAAQAAEKKRADQGIGAIMQGVASWLGSSPTK